MNSTISKTLISYSRFRKRQFYFQCFYCANSSLTLEKKFLFHQYPGSYNYSRHVYHYSFHTFMINLEFH